MSRSKASALLFLGFFVGLLSNLLFFDTFHANLDIFIWICIFGYLDHLDVDAYLDNEHLDGF
jgi:multisubunit Na+/H+ antiporter MnhE subunit